MVLACALRALGVRYLSGAGDPACGDLDRQDDHQLPDAASLIARLAASPDARLRQALVALFLVHPELAPTARHVADHLPDTTRAELVRHYAGAVYLQRLWHTRLQRFLGTQPRLPPYWIDELGLPPPEEGYGRPGLAALAAGTRRSAAPRDREGIYGRTAHLLFGQLLAERSAAFGKDRTGNAA